eukprot:scaffold9748_cov111-Cylindrotheca_fusiformis.AAC.2
MNKTPKATEDEVSALRPYDILCGRRKHCFNNIGNRRFRITVSLNVKKYDSIATRTERSKFIISLARTLKHDVGFRFLRILKNGEKVELPEEEVRAKIGHALRDLSTSLREGASVGSKKEVIKAKTTKSTNLVAPSKMPKIVTPTLKKERLFEVASTSQRYSLVAESTMPSLDENNDSSNNYSSNHVQEKDRNLPAVDTSASFWPSRERILVDDSLLSHPQQQKLEEAPTVSNFLPSSLGGYQPLRVGSMPMNLSPATEANYHPHSNTFFHDTKTFFSNTTEENNIAMCSMSSLDSDEENDDDDDDSFLGSRSLCHSVCDLSLMETNDNP